MHNAAVKKEGREFESVTLLRGLAALMVCFFHFTNGNKNLLPDSNWMKWLGDYCKWGVEVFFIISGFVLPYSMYLGRYSIKVFFTFFKKRIVRIEPPYIASIVLVLALGFISTKIPGYRGQPFIIDWWNVAGHLAYLNVFTGGHWLCDIYWTLAIEFQYYILIAFCFCCVASKNILYRILFNLLFLSCFVIKLADAGFIFFFTAYFCLGILLFQYKTAIASRLEFLAGTTCCLLLIAKLDGLYLASLSLFTVLSILYIGKVHAGFKYLGLISYSLYLTHVPVGGRVINFIESNVQNIFVRQGLVFVTLIAAIAFAAFFYLLIEKKCKAWASAIRY